MRWWQCGLLGGAILSYVTVVKLIRAIVRGRADDAEWDEVPWFFAAVFGMGFLCGVIVWTGKGLYRRIGMAGDAVVGMTVMVAFFASCMLLFEPALLGPKFQTGGQPMLGMAVVIGLASGAWIGHDLRNMSTRPTTQSHSPGREWIDNNPFAP